MIVAAIPFGVLAICISRALYTQIAVIINTYYTGKLFGLGYMEQIKDFSKYLICSIVAAIPAFVLSFCPFNSILILINGICISLLIYWLLLHKDTNFIDFINLIKKSK